MARQYALFQCLDCKEEFNIPKEKYDSYLASVVKDDKVIEHPTCIKCNSLNLKYVTSVSIDEPLKESIPVKKSKTEELVDVLELLEKKSINNLITPIIGKFKDKLIKFNASTKTVWTSIVDGILEILATIIVSVIIPFIEFMRYPVGIEFARFVKLLIFLIYWLILTHFIKFPAISNIDPTNFLIFGGLFYWIIIKK